MTDLHPDLATALGAASVLSPTRYVMLGEVRDVADAAGDGESRLLPALENDLYRRLYARPTPPPPGRARDECARRDFVAALSAANTGRGAWEPGWKVVRLEDDGTVAVARDDLTFWVRPDGLRALGGEPRPGAACRVKVAKEMRNLMPGYYVAIGDGGGDDEDVGEGVEPLVRSYWHLTRAAAVPFVRAMTALLNEAGVAFRAKVLSDPNDYLRADAGVLYLRRRDHERLGDALARLHAAVRPDLRPEVPLFTRRVASGLGQAEDRRVGVSFGQHRCGLVARALWRSFQNGDTDPAARAATTAAVFREEGLDPLRPDREPGPRDPDPFRPSPVGPDGRPEQAPPLAGAVVETP